MEKNTISLAQEVDMNALYFIDWQKVSSVNDLVLIIASLGVSFSPHHPAWEQIKHLADLSNPIKAGQPQATPKEIKLPKLKQL